MVPDNGNGGYPCIVVDSSGAPRVFWGEYRWRGVDTLEHQAIQTASYDSLSRQWSLPQTINSDNLTTRNQTVRAVVDGTGRIWAVWSGLRRNSDTWSIYLASSKDGQWSVPVEISSPGENGRAPVIAAGKGSDVWIAWHAGIGDDMKVKVLRYHPQAMALR